MSQIPQQSVTIRGTTYTIKDTNRDGKIGAGDTVVLESRGKPPIVMRMDRFVTLMRDQNLIGQDISRFRTHVRNRFARHRMLNLSRQFGEPTGLDQVKAGSTRFIKAYLHPLGRGLPLEAYRIRPGDVTALEWTKNNPDVSIVERNGSYYVIRHEALQNMHSHLKLTNRGNVSPDRILRRCASYGNANGRVIR